MAKTKTILVFCPNWVGDVVMATPAFTHLRGHYQNARIIAVIRKNLKPIINDAPWFDEVISGDDKTFKGFWALVKKLRALKPDTAVVLPNSQRAALLARFSGAKTVAGYMRNGRKLLLTQGPQPKRENGKIMPESMKPYYLKLVQNLGVTVDFEMKPALYYNNELAARAEELLTKYGIKDDDKVVGLIPGASFGSSKCWPPEHFAKLTEMLEKAYNCKIIMFTAPAEAEIGNAILAGSQAKIINGLPDNIGLDLLKPMIKRCNVLITNDTGPRHYGVAMNIPQIVVVMGSTSLRYTGTDLEKTVIVKKEGLACAPCQQKVCALKHHSCMREVTPAMVFDAVNLT